jgi:hypothetical protein
MLSNPGLSGNLLTLALALVPVSGLIYMSKPSSGLRYFIYISAALVVVANYATSGSFDALTVLLLGLIVAGVSIKK